MLSLLLSLLVVGPPADPDVVAMWIDDLGRLTPFGRTLMSTSKQALTLSSRTLTVTLVART